MECSDSATLLTRQELVCSSKRDNFLTSQPVVGLVDGVK